MSESIIASAGKSTVSADELHPEDLWLPDEGHCFRILIPELIDACVQVIPETMPKELERVVEPEFD